MHTLDDQPGAALIELGRRLTAVHHELVTTAAAFAASGDWKDQAPSAAHWIADHLDVHLGTAREWLRIGQALTKLPAIGEAFERGDLSYSKVRALTRVAEPATEAELLRIAMTVPASGLAAALARWATEHQDPAERDACQHARRRLTTWLDPDGMVAGFFRLPPERGARVLAALRAIVGRRARNPGQGSRDPHSDAPADASIWSTLPQQWADALVDLATGGGTASVTEIVLHVRGDGCSLDDGTPVTSTVAERLAPESFLRALIHDAEGRPINASARRRHPDARQRRVVTERDRACVDCGSTELLEFDHVPDYEHSKQTVVEELELRCAPCHHRRHGKAA